MIGSSYTDCYIKLSAKPDDYFSEEYEEYVGSYSDKLEELSVTRLEDLNKILSSMSMPEAEWYVLDLPSTNVSFVSFAMNVDKVSDIAGVFPIFFIVVAALVALTSMTRMVEEGRLQIGTLKSLGYSDGRIAWKYISYCLVAAILGCGVGIATRFCLSSDGNMVGLRIDICAPGAEYFIRSDICGHSICGMYHFKRYRDVVFMYIDVKRASRCAHAAESA